MIRSNLRLAVASIRRAKVRTFLTIIAVIIGVWSFTVVTTTVDGLKGAAANELENYGGNLVSIISGNVLVEDENGNEQLNFTASFGTSTLTETDYQDIKDTEGVEAVAPLSIIGASIKREGQTSKSGAVIATSPDYPSAFNQEVDQGTFLTEIGANTGRFVVLGHGLVEELYGGTVALGTKITIRGQDFTVIGSMKEHHSALDSFGGDLNNYVFISIENGKELNNGFISIMEIDAQLKENANPDKVKQRIEDALLENHRGEEDFTVLTQDELLEFTDSIFGIIKQAGQYLSGVMLFVSSIVILLIMLITVRERTREIGIRKSIGATNTNIMVQFLAEAITISWLGSGIGLGLGILSGFFVKNVTDITPAYTVSTLVTVAVISTTVGALAGVIPAFMAARRDPVEALRHE